MHAILVSSRSHSFYKFAVPFSTGFPLSAGESPEAEDRRPSAHDPCGVRGTRSFLHLRISAKHHPCSKKKKKKMFFLPGQIQASPPEKIPFQGFTMVCAFSA